MLAPEYTSFVSDSDLLASFVANSLAVNASDITITHLDDIDGRQAIQISGVNNYLIQSNIQFNVVIDADAPAGAIIDTQGSVWVVPEDFLIADDGTTESNSGSIADGITNGDLYNVVSASTVIGKVIAPTAVNVNNTIQGSEDAGAKTSVGTINVDNNQATGKTIIYNGSQTNITDTKTTINLVDSSTNQQTIFLTSAVTVVDQNGSAVSGATIVYYKDGSVVTDYTQADSFVVTNVGISNAKSATAIYNLKVNDSELEGIMAGKVWNYETSVQAYQSGSLATNDAVTLSTPVTATMSIEAIYTLIDNWYYGSVDSDGTIVQGDAINTATGVTGAVYNGSKLADIIDLSVGDVMNNNDQLIYQGVYDLSTGQYVSDPTQITFVENLNGENQIVGSTYVVLTAPRYTTTTKSVNYTVDFQGAGDQTPSEIQKSVNWTGVTDESTGITVWTRENTDLSVEVPSIIGYEANTSVVFDNVATTESDSPENESVTVTYTANDAAVNVNYYIDGTTTAITPSTTLNGKYAGAYTTTPAEVAGYTLKTTPKNANGTYGLTNDDVTYYYVVNYTLNHKDTDGNTIGSDENITGVPGETLTADDVTNIPGYTATATVLPDAPGNVTVTYTANDAAVNVNYYIDGTTTAITPSTTLNGKYAGAYTTTPAEVAGYTLKTTPKNANGTYGLTNDDVTYYYVVNYTLNHKDTDGNTIGSDENITGVPGETLTADDVTNIPGYTATTTVLPDTPGDVTVTYTSNKQRATVEIVDQNDNTLKTISLAGVSDGAVDHSTVAMAIQGVINQGYNLTSDGTVGAMYDHDDDADQIFKVVMTKIAVPDDTDNNSNPVPPTNDGGDVDNGGNTNNDNGNGNVDVPTNNGNETAQLNTNGNETPSTTTTNTGNGTTGTPQATGTTYVNNSGNTNTGDAVQKANANRLPQTDNNNESLLAEIGVAMMGLISVFGLGRKKKHEDD